MNIASDEKIEGRLRMLDLKGLFVGQLDPDEARIFEEMCRDGLAYRDYNSNAGAFMGLAKVGIR